MLCLSIGPALCPDLLRELGVMAPDFSSMFTFPDGTLFKPTKISNAPIGPSQNAR